MMLMPPLSPLPSSPFAFADDATLRHAAFYLPDDTIIFSPYNIVALLSPDAAFFELSLISFSRRR